MLKLVIAGSHGILWIVLVNKLCEIVNHTVAFPQPKLGCIRLQ